MSDDEKVDLRAASRQLRNGVRDDVDRFHTAGKGTDGRWRTLGGDISKNAVVFLVCLWAWLLGLRWTAADELRRIREDYAAGLNAYVADLRDIPALVREEYRIWRRRHDDLAVFLKADNLEGLRLAAAQFCLGNLSCSPDHHGPRMPETERIGEALAHANLLGLLTIGSQPGEMEQQDGISIQQRAVVEGWATGDTARQLIGLFEGTRIHVHAVWDWRQQRRAAYNHSFDATRTVGADGSVHVHTGFGFIPGRRTEFISLGREDLTMSLVWITIADPEWGEHDLLWRRLGVDDWANPPELADADRIATTTPIPSPGEIPPRWLRILCRGAMFALIIEVIGRGLSGRTSEVALDRLDRLHAFLHGLRHDEKVPSALLPAAPEAETCPCGQPAVDSGLCMDCIDAPNEVCDRCGYRHMEGGPCPTQPQRHGAGNGQTFQFPDGDEARAIDPPHPDVPSWNYENCPRPGCGGQMVPDGGVEPSYDEGDGTGSVPTHCSINCGTFSGYDWTMSDEDYTDVFGHGFDEVRDEELDGIAAPSGVMVDLDRLTAQAPAGTESVDVELPEIGEIPAEPGPQATLACPGGGTVRRGQRGWYVPGHGETQIPWTNALEVWGPGEDNRNRPFVVVSDPSGRYRPGTRLGYPEQPPVGSQFETGAVEGPFTWTRHPDGWSIDGTSSWRLSWPAVVKSYGIAEGLPIRTLRWGRLTRPPAFVMPDVPEIPNLEVKEFGCPPQMGTDRRR